MKYIAAYLLAKQSNDAPTEKEVKAVITAVGGEVDDARVTELFAQLADKDVEEIMAEGLKKLANCGGGAAAPAAGGAAPAAEAAMAGGEAVEKSGPAGLGDEEKLAETLQSMGFTDRKLVASVIRKVGLDVDACAHELVSLSEYDTMLSDLEEMGFNDRERNQQLLVENSGSIKKTVKSLIADPSA